MPLPDRPNGRYARLRGGRPRCGGLPAQRFLCLLDEKQVYFFRALTSVRIVYGTEDAQGVVQRTAALSALRREMAAGEYRIICTYPEALAERVTDPDSMRRETVRVKVGDRLAIGELEELLADSGFTKVDFVYEPDSIRCVAVSSTCFLFREQTLPVGLFRGRGGFDPPIRDFQSAFRRPAERGGDRSEPERFCRGSDFAARICRRGDLLVFRSRLRTAARERSASQGSGGDGGTCGD